MAILHDQALREAACLQFKRGMSSLEGKWFPSFDGLGDGLVKLA